MTQLAPAATHPWTTTPHAGTPRKSALTRLFDRAAMGLMPLVARAFGYTFRVGADEALARDARGVLRAVWSAKGVHPPADVAWYGERYDAATTWIVAYHGGHAIAVMGLLDMRIASMALDYGNRLAPSGLALDTTREIGRLAILPEHRGGARVVMVGLLIEMLAWSLAHGIETLFAGSVPSLYRVYQRYNPTARLVYTPLAPSEPLVKARYFAPLRAYGGKDVVYTFSVAGATPSSVLTRCLAALLTPSDEPRRTARTR